MANQKKIILIILILSFIKGALWAAIVPKWEVDDEPAYWANVLSIAAGKSVKYQGYSPTNHPKLFPLLATPIYLILKPLSEDTQVFFVRLLSALLGTVVVFLGYKISKLVLPNSFFTVILVPISLTFMPQFSYIMASVNSDVLLNFLMALFLYQLIKLILGPISRREVIFLLITLIAGVYAKERFLVAFPILAFTIFFYVIFQYRHLLAKIFLPLTPGKVIVVALAVFFFVNYLLPQISMAVGVRFGSIAASLFTLEQGPVERAREAVFFDWVFVREFWGWFGWLKVPLSNLIYRLFYLYTVMGVLGFLVLFIKQLAARLSFDPLKLNLPSFEQFWRPLLVVMVLIFTIFVAVYATAAYDIYGAGALGRYTFIAVIPFFFFVSWGWEQFFPERIKRLGLAAFFSGFLFLNLLSLTYIMTAFY